MQDSKKFRLRRTYFRKVLFAMKMAQFGGNVDILAKHFIFLLKFRDFVAKYEDLLHQKLALNLSKFGASALW